MGTFDSRLFRLMDQATDQIIHKTGRHDGLMVVLPNRNDYLMHLLDQRPQTVVDHARPVYLEYRGFPVLSCYDFRPRVVMAAGWGVPENPYHTMDITKLNLTVEQYSEQMGKAPFGIGVGDLRRFVDIAGRVPGGSVGDNDTRFFRPGFHFLFLGIRVYQLGGIDEEVVLALDTPIVLDPTTEGPQ